MNKSGLEMDFSMFNKEFGKLVKKVGPELTEKGLREAGQELKIDADNIPPRTPHLEGTLVASGKVGKVEVKGNELSVSVKYETPYAARWHEAEPGTINWSEPGVGPKYLESKMTKFKLKYINIIAEVLRKKFK